MAVPARGGNTRSIAQAMDPAASVQDWLFETIANRFAAALETETGEQPDMRWERVTPSAAEFAGTGKQDLK